MKAIVFRRYGGPDVLERADVPRPEPGNGEVLIEVCATTACSGDLRLRRAQPFFMRAYSGWRRPDRIPVLGMELSGRVEKCGKSVEGFAVGDEVFGSTGLKFGAYAERACVPAVPLLAHAPRNLPLSECAALSYGGVSAMHFLRAAGVGAGSRVLIWGATGNVGTFAVQLAKRMGAHVTATCSARNFDFVRGLGADDLRDYAKDEVPRPGDSFDLIFDTVGKSRPWRWLRAVKRGGSYAFAATGFASYLGLVLLAKLTGRLRVHGGIARTRPGDLDYLRQLVEEGALRPVIDRAYPLAEIAAAHRHAEAGHKRGSILVLVRN
ncbi:MAG TPA: NAD(P)-dependent alcohol dehydrogenase [Rhizomicrobium sp.]|nr:NAD(P)-dependent alcohol dehydrogenase [Rhizomicrobium sp.]